MTLACIALQVVDAWSVDQKQRFVAFVTGAQRPCPMGPEVLNIIVAWVPPGQRDSASVLQRLPQASSVHLHALHACCRGNKK